jgi:PPOX class probable F420-dependent enzyme
MTMPRGPVPDRYNDLLEARVLGHLATVTPAGKPQVNPVWFIAEPDVLYLGARAETAKLRNMRANPAVALSISDLDNPGRYLELRGEVIALELYETLEWVNVLARKYTGADFPPETAGDPRYKITVRIEAWTGQG